MDDCYRDFAVVPVLDILTGLQLPDSKALFDALQVVLKPVGHQHRFFIGGFNQILQSVQLAVMELHHIAGIGINGTIGQLHQFPGERGGIGSSDFFIRKVQYQFCFQLLVAVFLIFGKLHLILGRDQLRHLQVIGTFHGNRNIRNLSVDGFLCIGQRFVGVDDLPVALVRHEVVVSVLRDKPAKALAHIQQSELCPEVHETVGAWCTSEADDAFDFRSDLQQCLEAF